MFSSMNLDEATAMKLDRYVGEKVISVVSKEIDKEKWSDESILLLKSYQNEIRQSIKDLWIKFDRHNELILEIKNKINPQVLTSLELSNDPVKILEDRVRQLEKTIAKITRKE